MCDKSMNALLEEGFALKIVSKDEFDAFKLAKVGNFVKQNPGSTIDDIAGGLNISYKSADRYLMELRKLGVVFVYPCAEKVYRCYPNPEAEKFFKLSSSLLIILAELEEYIENLKGDIN